MFAENILVEKILKSYLKRLTNLSSRNKSLVLLNLSQEQFLDIHELDFLQNKPSFSIIEALIARKNTIPLCEILDSRYERNNAISQQLKRISRTEKFIEEERGSKDLYVGYPFVRGKFADGTVVCGPLFFFPVTLQQQAQKWVLQSLSDEPISFNRSLLLAYSHFNQVKILDEFLEKNLEDFDTDSLVFRTQLYDYLKDSSLSVNFNQELLANQLQFFEKILKSDLEETERNGELKLYPQAVLGIFPQSGSYLVPDYEWLLNLTRSVEPPQPSLLWKGGNVFCPSSPLERRLGGGDASSEVSEANSLTPFPIDASQEAAFVRVKNGESLVIQGPPGTGKSQLICNLIADFAARGKRVLLICQKRVALDVVYERLAQAGMSQFVALVHDFKNDRKALYEQILNQIEEVEAYKKRNYSLDAIFLERNFTQECRQIDRISEELRDFKTALFDDTECGISVKELYLTSQPNEVGIELGNFYKSFNFNELPSFIKRFESYIRYEETIKKQDVFWTNRVDFQHFQLTDLPKIEQAVWSMPAFVEHLEKDISAHLEKPYRFADFLVFLEEQKSIEAFLQTIQNEAIWQIFQEFLTKKTFSITTFNQLAKTLLACFEGHGLAQIDTTQINSFAQQLAEAINQKSTTVGGIFWNVFNKQKTDIQIVALKNGLSVSYQDLRILQEKIQNRKVFEEAFEQLKTLVGFEGLSDNYSNQTAVNQLLDNYQNAHKAEQLAKKIALFKNNPKLLNLSWKIVEKKMNELFEKLQQITENQILWQKYLTNNQIEQLTQTNEIPSKNTFRNLFDVLVETDTQKAAFTRTEWEVISQSIAQQPVDTVTIFINSVKLAWIAHIEEKYPILRSVSSPKMADFEENLQLSIQKKQSLSQEILMMKLREQTYNDLTFNRLNNLTTFRELKHQVAKKRKIWAIRKLMSEFQEEVFRLIPCWLASPETVSAVFPMPDFGKENLPDSPTETQFSILNSQFSIQNQFDLVIFDEASQCFAEEGIPAMYRGKQIVITGDAKQLPPSDLYRVRFEDDDTEDIAALEVDSLLDLACQYLPQTQLKGHYRSRSLDLIDFSNQHFYKNTLHLLPDFQEINKKNPAIQYLKVEGVWESQRNKAEAQTVVDLVNQLNQDFPEKNIGIVTFNSIQQRLIQDLLEAEALEVKASLFVKNIENVQGDERDIIIFSVGYAPDAKGKLTMQFGSLNQVGGENRLNVAITRAKERVYVVSSILPQQLKVENVLNEGPKMLKLYLEYAWQVSEGHYKPSSTATTDYQANWFLKEQLAQKSPNLIKELSFADLTEKENGQYKSLVLTDDDLYFDSLSPKEAHAYWLTELKAKGWTFKRVFSREFWRNHSTES